MSRPDDFRERSYASHALHYDEYAQTGEKSDHARTWLDDGTIDAWRHRRMHASLDPLIENAPDASWVTLGDGRYASDARYLQSKGLRVVATDISDALLKEAHELGLISAYQAENVEDLSFGDKSFDFVLCKETFHHLPRPMIGLYEMIRIARKAVVLIEPADPYLHESVLEIAFHRVLRLRRRLLRRAPSRHAFESSGNYTYTLSKREVEKAALGLNLPTVAFRELNDAYAEGGEVEAATVGSSRFRAIRRRLALRDSLTKLGVYQPNMLVAVVFTTPIELEMRRALARHHFEVTDLPPNPFI